MELSILLAKLLGLYFLIISAIWLVRKEQFEKLASDIISSEPLIGLSGFISLILGLAIVITHPVWWRWPLVITLIGYLSILKGIMRIGFPVTFQKMASRMMFGCCCISLIIITLLGIYLTYHGFMN